jgi:hypothetical protein
MACAGTCGRGGDDKGGGERAALRRSTLQQQGCGRRVQRSAGTGVDQDGIVGV